MDDKKVTHIVHKEDTIEDSLRRFAIGEFLPLPDDDEQDEDILTVHIEGSHGAN